MGNLRLHRRRRRIAPMLPIARALKAAGNRVVSILGGRNKELIIMRPEMEAASHEVIYTTDDGSFGTKGLVTHALNEFIAGRGKPGVVFAIGPAIMMKAVAELTRPLAIPTIVSLNTIMIDGTGMCGGCRVAVGDESKFVCVDGPEFDAHQVDFDSMMKRQRTYHAEAVARERFQRSCTMLRGPARRRWSDGAPQIEKKERMKIPGSMPAQDPRSGSKTSTRWRWASPRSWPSPRPTAASSASSQSASRAAR
jgi:hypothetical protein